MLDSQEIIEDRQACERFCLGCANFIVPSEMAYRIGLDGEGGYRHVRCTVKFLFGAWKTWARLAEEYGAENVRLKAEIGKWKGYHRDAVARVRALKMERESHGMA